jgi:hypothetical protein
MAAIVFITVNTHASGCHGGSLGSSDHSEQHATENADNSAYKVKFQTICPVTGAFVGRTIYADWEGDENNTPKRIYLCCKECIKKFNRKPAKYVRKLIKSGQYVENNFQYGK